MYFWVLCVLLGAAALLGGGSRGDILSLLILRPLGAASFVVGLSGIYRERAKGAKWPILLCFGWLGWAVLQLLPLPPALWTLLPGRELVVAGGVLAGVSDGWRPISLTPDLTVAGIFAALLPVAAFLLALRCDARERRTLFVFVGIVIIFSGLLGVIQILGPVDSPLYFYKITNPGIAVGLFANRNHQATALVLAIPIIALLLSPKDSARPGKTHWPVLIFAGSLLLLVPLILLTGSRSGLVTMGVALLPIAYTMRSTWNKSPWLKVATLAIVAGIVAVVALLARSDKATTFSRLTAGGDRAELRFRVWPDIWEMALSNLPTGTGMGSFQSVYQIGEREANLGPAYFNHAHNDWLETLLTGGFPASLVVLAFGAWVITVVFKTRRMRGRQNGSAEAQRQTAALIIFIFGIASLVDYTLRVPFLACLFAISVACLIPPRERGAKHVENPKSLV